MSSYVCSDHTILAIVEGMRKYGMIPRKKADSRDMCESLRFINEVQTCTRYGTGHMRTWAVEQDHRPVREAPRKYTDGETLAAIACYLYQIDTAPLHDLDFITLVSAVKILREKIVEAGEAAGTLRSETEDGCTRYLERVEGDLFVDVTERYDWDLAA